jgi:hypothetical protein
MEAINFEWVRTLGNRLMGEFEEVLTMLEGATTEGVKDMNTDGEETVIAGQNKYAFLERSRMVMDSLKKDYLDFAQYVGFPANTGGWDLPFDENFKQVDIEMDNQVVDRYFDVNIRNSYRNIFKAKLMSQDVFHKLLLGKFFPCPCCRVSYFEKSGSYEICPVCGWENDRVQNADAKFAGGANKDSLEEAKIKYQNKHAGWSSIC